MRVTIVPEDKYIQVDGRGLVFDFVCDPNIHAIQWYHDYGIVELKIGGSRPATYDEVHPYVLEWEQEKQRLEVPPKDPPPLTNEQIVAQYTRALEQYYDDVAKRKQYDNRYTCALRAGYPGPFQDEGKAFGSWMDTCNAYGYQVVSEVQQGLREKPTPATLITELPYPPW